jgi:hypothetical protein
VYICEAEKPKPSAQIRTAKPNSTCGKESEGVYKQFNQQKGVTRAVYYEHGDKMDQFSPAPATHQ